MRKVAEQIDSGGVGAESNLLSTLAELVCERDLSKIEVDDLSKIEVEYLFAWTPSTSP